jgi:type IV pilus assembly protein PilM
MLGGKQQLIGVDIGSNSVKVVELKPKKKGYVVKNAVEVTLTPDVIVEGAIMDYGEVAGAVAEAFKTGKFSARNVATGLKGSGVIAKRLSVPITDQDELRETFIWEAEQYIQMDIEDVSIDYETIDIDEDKGETDLVMAAARKDLIVDFKSVLEAAKLKPIVVDLEVFAMINAFTANYESEDKAVVLVNIGHSTAIITIVRDGNYEFSREILRGGRNLTEMISQSLSISYDEAGRLMRNSGAIERDQALADVVSNFNSMIAMEIKNSIEMFDTTGQSKPSRCFICGGVATLPGLRETIEKVVEADVSMFDPFARMEISGTADKTLTNDNLHSFAVAAGLALRSAGEK